MANYLAHTLVPVILAAFWLIPSVVYAQAKEPQDPKGDRPPAAEEPTKKEIDASVELAFGKDSAEMRRPIRLWLPTISTVLAAEKATLGQDNLSVRLEAASVRLANDADDIKVFRGDEIVVVSIGGFPVTNLGDLQGRQLRFEIHNKNLIVTIVPFVEFREKVVVVKLPGGAEEKKVVQEAVGSGGDTMRYKFTVDAKTPLAELLPIPQKTQAKLPLWTNDDLTEVPELAFGESISKALPKVKAIELTAHRIAKINHLNRAKTDGFMLAMIEQRGDLRGLPFLMGDECRTREEQAKVFASIADRIRQAFGEAKKAEATVEGSPALWSAVAELNLFAQEGSVKGQAKATFNRSQQDYLHRTLVAALMQILMPESEKFRMGLAKSLATIPHIDATKALAKLVLFAPEDEVRAAAIEGLKLRREKDYTNILMQGFTYPLPAVSKRAAEALVKLERKDLLENLVQVLETPDPRLPVTQKRDGKEVAVVRELVKVNHHRNCLLCHAPGNTENTPEGVLKVAVPLPGEPLPKPSEGGGYQSTPPATPDIVVRIDMTYLRQDFSLMMPVSDAHPWPEMQRFDFLVRTRTLTAAETKTYESADEPGLLSPYHRAALFALRELTGRDTEPTAAAWRTLLKLPK